MSTLWTKFPLQRLCAGLLTYLAMQVLVLGIPTISGSSEARESLVVDVIVRDGTWVLPLRNGIVPSKPPLYHWLAASLSIVLGGVDEFTVRLNSQLAGALVMVFVALVAYRFALLANPTLGEGYRRRATLGAAAVTSMTYGFYVMANQAMVDMVFALCVWGALASLALASESAWDTRRRISGGAKCAFFLFCALGVLARGPLGGILPVILAVVAGCLSIGLRATIQELLRPSLGWAFMLLPVAWYYFAYRQGGAAFIERQILFENLQRFSGGEHINTERWWFYIPSFLRTTFPWGALMLLLAVWGGRGTKTLSYPTLPWPRRWLPAVLCGVGVTLFSFSSGKRHSYLLPLLPLTAVQVGVEVSRLFELGGESARQSLLRAGRKLLLFNTSAVVLLLGVGAIVSGLDYSFSPPIALALPSLLQVLERFGSIMILLVAAGSLAIRSSHTGVFLTLWLQLISLLTLVTTSGTAIKAHYKGFDEMASEWTRLSDPSDDLVVIKHPFDEYFDPMLFYVRRPVRVVSSELQSFTCRPGAVYLARRQWIDLRRQALELSITRGVVIRERLLASTNDDRRDIVAFRCDEGAGGLDGNGAGSRMKEASLSTRKGYAEMPAT